MKLSSSATCERINASEAVLCCASSKVGDPDGIERKPLLHRRNHARRVQTT